jgi:uncharacterized protein YcbK (DUF882 family)
MRIVRETRAASTVAAAIALASGIALADPPKPASHPPRPSPGAYHSWVSKWHAVDPNGHAPLDGHGRAKLVLVSLNTSDRVELDAAGERGGFAASDLDRAAFVLREPSSGNEHPVEPRVIDLAYRIQTHFDAQEIRVISAYRTPRGRNASNHGRGRAIDMVVPGVPDADVATFARELGYVGVGIYPTSGFVHVDVRDRSYFWVDASGPGRRDRERPILGKLAAKSDEAAATRGERQVSPFEIATDVDAAIRAHVEPAAPDHGEDEDDDVHSPISSGD